MASLERVWRVAERGTHALETLLGAWDACREWVSLSDLQTARGGACGLRLASGFHRFSCLDETNTVVCSNLKTELHTKTEFSVKNFFQQTL